MANQSCVGHLRWWDGSVEPCGGKPDCLLGVAWCLCVAAFGEVTPNSMWFTQESGDGEGEGLWLSRVKVTPLFKPTVCVC